MTGPAAGADPSRHWDEVYARESTEFSWHQRDPGVSLRLVTSHAPPGAAVLDVGAGDSTLVDRLLDEGYTDLTVMDLSRVALERVARRLGPRDGVHYVVGDVRRWRPSRHYDLWHDRAVFHFLVDPADQRLYVDLAAGALEPRGTLVLACFDDDGPTHCSGLPVARHGAPELAELFKGSFVLESSEREVHRTPSGATQPFTWVVLNRSGTGT